MYVKLYLPLENSVNLRSHRCIYYLTVSLHTVNSHLQENSLTEITSPLASDSMPSENNPLVTPKPISMHRSASFGTPGVQTDRRNAKPGLVATTYMSTPYFYVRQCHSLTKKTYTLP
ncbi:uncharacterized protein LOC143230263 isoform X4 [Tachypleus tridentatus]|uniref:uncharacterized protein LOC143230263 isoform X4 n=1 Tax=Tachypleus tridentatus TaxID=6853 RepID=UPI003FD55C9D